METIAVIDFETTGLSMDRGDRATEVAVILLADGKVTARYQSLMNAGVRIPAFIEELTGITNAMIQRAPPAAKVMGELADFLGDTPLVAHNAGFDRKVLDAEWHRIHWKRRQEFVCSMLLARRIYQTSPNHKLETLVHHLGLPCVGRYHRAMADAEMTAGLFLQMVTDLKRRYGLSRAPHAFLKAMQKAPRWRFDHFVERARSQLVLSP